MSLLFFQFLSAESMGERTDEYVEALCKEVRETALMMKGRKLDTIYIGGGTPTTLLPHQIRKLLDTVGEAFGFE